MAWSEITDRNIGLEGDEFTYNCMASGTIKKGQAVTLANNGATDNVWVIAGTLATAGKFYGIAAIDAYKTSSVSVYGHGSVCWTRADTSVDSGDILHADDDGEFDNCADANSASMSGAAICITTQGTSAGLIKVKLL